MIVSLVLLSSIVLALVFLRDIKSKKNSQDDNGIKHKGPGIIKLLKSTYEILFKVNNDGNELITSTKVKLKS